MGIDDLINKAKDLLGQGEDKADQAAASAQAGDTAAAASQATESASLIDKAKGLLTDERIDSVADSIKAKTPDNIDKVVDNVADKAKTMNG